MAGGIGHGCLDQVGGVPIAEGTAGRRELDAAQARGGNPRGEAGRLGPGGALQALEDGRMLGIGRQQPRAGPLKLRQHHRSGRNQGLLVGQGQVLAGPNRREGGQQAGATDDAGDHQIGRGPGGGGAEALGAAQQLGQGGRAVLGIEGQQALPQGRDQVAIGQGHHLRTVALDLVNQQVEVAAGGEGHHAEAIGKVLDDLQGLGADRARGSQHAEGFHRRIGKGGSQSPTGHAARAPGRPAAQERLNWEPVSTHRLGLPP